MATSDFWDRLDRGTHCWLWVGTRDPRGYGMVKVGGRVWKAHRFAWSLSHDGCDPGDASIIQSCENRACCRPDHLIRRAPRQRQRVHRRSSGSGSLDEVRPAVWELRVSLGRNPTTGSYDRATRTFEGTSTEAHKALARLVAEAEAGNIRMGSATMDALFDAWLLHLKRIGRSPNYITVARRKIDHDLRPAVGRRLARKVSVTVLDELLASLASDQRAGGALSAATIAQHKRILSSVFSYAWKRDIVPTNPVRKVDVPPAAKLDIVEPTIDELITLMEVAEAEPVRRSKYGRPMHRPELSTAIWLGAVLGVREAELCALRLHDFDWNKRRVRIGHSVYVDEDGGSGPHLKDAKSHKVRYVALDPVSIQVILEQFDWMSSRAETAATGVVGNPYLFSDGVDGSPPWRPVYVARWFAKLRSRCEGRVRREVHFHSLRHFHSTHALDLGYPITAVAGRNGHDPSVLLKVYAHHLEQTDRRISEAVAALVPKPKARATSANTHASTASIHVVA